jgi:hypothetical protein
MAPGSSRESLTASASPKLGHYADMPTARSVTVHDAWYGMSAEAPIVTTFDLQRTDQRGLVGTLRHSRREQLQYAREIEISRSTTTRLLRLLGSAPLVSEPYEPFIDHTDDFPRIEIVVVLEPVAGLAPGVGMVLLTSTSQGELHTPWSVSMGDTTWTSPGEQIGRALAMLNRANKQP